MHPRISQNLWMTGDFSAGYHKNFAVKAEPTGQPGKAPPSHFFSKSSRIFPYSSFWSSRGFTRSVYSCRYSNNISIYLQQHTSHVWISFEQHHGGILNHLHHLLLILCIFLVFRNVKKLIKRWQICDVFQFLEGNHRSGRKDVLSTCAKNESK